MPCSAKLFITLGYTQGATDHPMVSGRVRTERATWHAFARRYPRNGRTPARSVPHVLSEVVLCRVFRPPACQTPREASGCDSSLGRAAAAQQASRKLLVNQLRAQQTPVAWVRVGSNSLCAPELRFCQVAERRW